MSAISTYLQQILNAIWARDVRQAIHDAISQCYDDVNKPALQTEAMQAAVQAKIDAGQMAALTIADGSITGAKLANGTISTGKIANGAITAGKIASGVIPPVLLLSDEIPDTTQTYTFSSGSVSQVTHSRNGVAIRTDAFTYEASTITEVRTLNTGESLTIVTNLTTLETTVTYAAA